MIQCHWDSFNTFQHYGRGDFGLLGWDALKEGDVPLFDFSSEEQVQLARQLIEAMPYQLDTILREGPVTVDGIRRELANKTAAPFDMLDNSLIQLAKEKELKISSALGIERSRRISRLKGNDRIDFPDMPLLPGFSRKK